MTDADIRLGRLEAWREAHGEDIHELREAMARVEAKVDGLAARAAPTWLMRGFMPAVWMTLLSSAASIVTIHFVGH